MHSLSSIGRFLSGTALVAALGLTVAGCANEPPDSDAASEEAGVFQGSGRLRTAPPGGRFVRLEHGDIPGFMAAMTMAFELSDSTLATGIAVGDSVRFEVTVVGGAAVVTALEAVEAPQP